MSVEGRRGPSVCTRYVSVRCAGERASHLVSAVGRALIDAAYQVPFTHTADIGQDLLVARQSPLTPSALVELRRFVSHSTIFELNVENDRCRTASEK